MIRFQHVYKEYPRTGLVLQDVSLFVGKGEFVFLTGPSGAGKSSLLKLVYMEELPTKGDVWVSGVRAKGVKRKEVAKLRRKPRSNSELFTLASEPDQPLSAFLAASDAGKDR